MLSTQLGAYKRRLEGGSRGPVTEGRPAVNPPTQTSSKEITAPAGTAAASIQKYRSQKAPFDWRKATKNGEPARDDKVKNSKSAIARRLQNMPVGKSDPSSTKAAGLSGSKVVEKAASLAKPQGTTGEAAAKINAYRNK